MWAQPSIPTVIGGSHRTLAHHGRPDQPINVLDRLDHLRLNNTHPLQDIRLLSLSSTASIFYNTVILDRLGGGGMNMSAELRTQTWIDLSRLSFIITFMTSRMSAGCVMP